MVKQPNDTRNNLSTELSKRFHRWLLLTVDPLLIIAHLTLIYIVALKADDLVLTAIVSSFGNLIQQSRFASKLLLGIRLFSAIGIALAYGLHTIYQLYLEGKHIFEALGTKPAVGSTETDSQSTVTRQTQAVITKTLNGAGSQAVLLAEAEAVPSKRESKSVGSESDV